jgi:hypothetical protein
MMLADWLLLCVPWIAWFTCVNAFDRQKSLSNLGEAYLLALVCTVLYWLRIKVVARNVDARTGSYICLGLACLVAALMALTVPALPE